MRKPFIYILIPVALGILVIILSVIAVFRPNGLIDHIVVKISNFAAFFSMLLGTILYGEYAEKRENMRKAELRKQEQLAHAKAIGNIFVDFISISSIGSAQIEQQKILQIIHNNQARQVRVISNEADYKKELSDFYLFDISFFSNKRDLVLIDIAAFEEAYYLEHKKDIISDVSEELCKGTYSKPLPCIARFPDSRKSFCEENVVVLCVPKELLLERNRINVNIFATVNGYSQCLKVSTIVNQSRKIMRIIKQKSYYISTDNEEISLRN